MIWDEKSFDAVDKRSGGIGLLNSSSDRLDAGEGYRDRACEA